MIRNPLGLLGLGVLLLVAAPLSAEWTVVFAEGPADYRPDLGSSWTPVSEGLRFPEGGYIRTGRRGALELENKAKARVVFSENTLARVRFDGPAAQDRLLVHTGTVLTDVTVPGSHLQVRTKTAVMGVRGTQFTVLASPRQGTQVAVREGRVFVVGSEAQNGQPSGQLVEPGRLGRTDSDGRLAVETLPAGRDAYGFGAFEDLEAGRPPRTFERFQAQDRQLFRDFSDADLADFQLYLLDDLDQQWQFFLNDRQALADQLWNAPLKAKP